MASALDIPEGFVLESSLDVPEGFVIEERQPDELGIGQEVRGVGRALKRGFSRAVQAGEVLKGRMLETVIEREQEDLDNAQTPEAKARATGTLERARSIMRDIPSRIATSEKAIQALPVSPDLETLNTEFWSTFARNPVETIATVAAESLPQSIAGTAIGAAVAGPPGMIAGTAANSFGAEYANTILQSAREQGVDLTDPVQVSGFLADKEKMEAARTKGSIRGLPIAAFDAASAGLAGRFIKPVLGKGLKPVSTATAKELGTQMTAGAAGETAGQLASEGRITSVPDIAMEAMAELATAPGEVTGNLIAKKPDLIQPLVTAAVSASNLRAANAPAMATAVEDAALDDLAARLAAEEDEAVTVTPEPPIVTPTETVVTPPAPAPVTDDVEIVPPDVTGMLFQGVRPDNSGGVQGKSGWLTDDIQLATTFSRRTGEAGEGRIDVYDPALLPPLEQMLEEEKSKPGSNVYSFIGLSDVSPIGQLLREGGRYVFKPSPPAPAPATDEVQPTPATAPAPGPEPGVGVTAPPSPPTEASPAITDESTPSAPEPAGTGVGVKPAVTKVKAKLSQVASPSTKAARQAAVSVKSQLIQKLEEAITKAPSLRDERPEGSPLSVTIEIPDDGTFRIQNDKETIQGVLDRVVKIQTSTPPKTKIPSGRIAQSQHTRLIQEFILPDDVTERDAVRAEGQLQFFEDATEGMSADEAIPAFEGHVRYDRFFVGLEAAMVGKLGAIKSKTVGEARKWLTDRVAQVKALAITEEPTQAPSIGDRAIAAIESLKAKPGDAGAHSTFFPLLDAATARAIWNTALDVAIGAVKAGQTIVQAVDAAVQWIRDSGNQFDEALVRQAMNAALDPQEPGAGPSGQTFTGPTRERDKTSKGQSSLYQSEGPARSEAQDDALAKQQTDGYGDDLERAYRDAKDMDEVAYRQVVLSEILSRVMTRLGQSQMHDVAMRQLAGRLSETFKTEGREAGQALQSRAQANEKLLPHMPLLSWLNMLRQRYDDAIRKPLGDKFDKIVEAFRKSAKASREGKTVKERNTSLFNLLEKELKDLGLDKKHRDKILKSAKPFAEAILNKQLSQDELLAVLADAYGLEKEDGPTAQKLAELADKAAKAPEGLPRHRIVQEMMDLVFDKAPVDWRKLAEDIWFGSVLMRLGTFLNVAVGSSASSTMFSGAQMIDRVARGDLKGAARLVHQYFSGLTEGAQIAMHIARTGDYSLLPDFQERAKRFFEGNAKPDQLEAMMRKGGWRAQYPGKLAYTRRIMTALDYIFATAHRDSALLYSALTRKDKASIDAISRKWDKEATRLAEQQALNELGPTANKAQIKVRRRQILEEGVSEEVKAAAQHLGRRVAANADPSGLPGIIYNLVKPAPFWIKAPAGLAFLRAGLNTLQNAADLYPGIGMAKATIGRLGEQTGSKTWANLPEERRMQVAMQATGLAATAAIAGLVLRPKGKKEDEDKKFELTGSWTGIKPQQAKALRDKGERPYSIGIRTKSGMKWIGYRQSPLIAVLAAVGYLRDRQRFQPDKFNEDAAAEQIVGAWISGATSLKDISMLSALTAIPNWVAGATDDPQEMMDQVNRSIAQGPGRFAAGYIPSVIKELDEVMDPQLYRPGDKDKLSGYWLRNFPFARRTVSEGPELNILGDPVKQVRPPLRQYLSSEDSNDPPWRALGHALNNGVFPTYVSTTTTVTEDGEKRRMTSEEFYRYRREYGKEVKELISNNAAEIQAMDREALVKWFGSDQKRWKDAKVRAKKAAMK